MLRKVVLIALFIFSASRLVAELSVPSVFTDHMVLQRDLANKVWGWGKPETKVTVTFAGKNHKGQTDDKGTWSISLDPSPANSISQNLSIKGSGKLEIKDVLVGEVWLCSGQQNMRFIRKKEVNGDLKSLASANNMIRLLRIPSHGIQEPQNNFDKQWELCSPDSTAEFSSIGFFYGRYLQEILDVPVGLIDNSWGGSAAEAWVRRDLIAEHPLLSTRRERMARARSLSPVVSCRGGKPEEPCKTGNCEGRSHGQEKTSATQPIISSPNPQRKQTP